MDATDAVNLIKSGKMAPVKVVNPNTSDVDFYLPVREESKPVMTTILTVASLALNTTSSDSTVLDFATQYPKQLVFTIAGTFAATAAATGLRLQVFYSPDGTNWDTDAYATIEPTFTASSSTSQTKQKSRPVTAVPGYYKCNVVNLDGTNLATSILVTATEVV